VDDQTDTAQQQSSTRRTRWVLWSAALAAILVIGAGAILLRGWPSSAPESAISGIATAAIRGDSDAVAASIDSSSLVNTAVDDVFSDADERRALISAYLSKHPGVTEDQVKVKARELFDQEIREHVEDGTLPKRIPLGATSLKLLAAKVLVKRSVKSIEVDGDVAHVTVDVPYKGKTLSVQLRMTQSGGTWKVDQVENLNDVLDEAGY